MFLALLWYRWEKAWRIPPKPWCCQCGMNQLRPPSYLSPWCKFHQTLDVGSSMYGQVHCHPGCGGNFWIRLNLGSIFHQEMNHRLYRGCGRQWVSEYCISSSRLRSSSRGYDLMSTMKARSLCSRYCNTWKHEHGKNYYTALRPVLDNNYDIILSLIWCMGMVSHISPCEDVSLIVLLKAYIFFSFCILIGSRNSTSEPFTKRSRMNASLASIPTASARNTSNSTSAETEAPDARL